MFSINSTLKFSLKGFDCSASIAKCHTLHSIAYVLSLHRFSNIYLVLFIIGK